MTFPIGDIDSINALRKAFKLDPLVIRWRLSKDNKTWNWYFETLVP